MCYFLHYICIVKNKFLINWNIQLKKGLLPLYVLQALEKKECYGYELIQELKLEIGIDVKRVHRQNIQLLNKHFRQ